MKEPYCARLTRLRRLMVEEGLPALLISRPQHLFYLTGERLPATMDAPAVLAVTAGDMAFAGPRELEDIHSFTYPTYDIHSNWDAAQGSQRALTQAVRALGLSGVVGAELPFLPAHLAAVLSDQLIALRDCAPLLFQLRKTRDADELARIRANLAVNEQIFAAFAAALRPGVSDWELWTLVYRVLCESIPGPVDLQADLGIGEAGAEPSAKPSGRLARRGDTVFLDIYSSRDGYYADTTRGFTVGEPDARQREIHAILARALQAGEAQLRPGVPAFQVDQAVRGVISAAGRGNCFPHHSGHAFNFFQQDRPYFIPGEPEPLVEGMTVTLEPGIYIPGWGGMRLERNYLVTSAGPELLDRYPLGLNGQE